jgi:hypothetical protein
METRSMPREFSPQDVAAREKTHKGKADTLPADDLVAMLDARRIRVADNPPRPAAVVSLRGQGLSTAGNITVLAAQPKAGKSASLGAMVAAMFPAPNTAGLDFLGWECAPAEGAAVVWFDTEQSTFDSWKNVKRATDRTGLPDFPENLRAFCLVDVPTVERRELLPLELERARKDCGRVHAVFLDGVGDLCQSVNDEKEANGLVDELCALATEYQTVIITVLHENSAAGPQQTGKTRGHLGSQLERKAESNLRLVKGSDGVTEVFSEKCRSANLPRGHGAFFAWDDASGMHITVEGVPGKKAGVTPEDLAGLLPLPPQGMRTKELRLLAEEEFGISKTKFHTLLSLAKQQGLIAKNKEGLYERVLVP